MELFKRYLDTDYEVSNCGNIRTIPHRVMKSDGAIHPVKQTYLRFAKDEKGYLKCTLVIKRILKTFRVHRIVAQTFILNPENKPQVNHIDGIKHNNTVNNLEWCTNQENQIHAFKLGLSTPNYGTRINRENFKRGKNNHATKLTEINVISARDMRRKGMSFQKIADEFNVNKKTIIHAIKGVTWSYVREACII